MKHHNCLECGKEWDCIIKDCRVPIEIYCSPCAEKDDMMSIIRGTHPHGCHIAIQNGLLPVKLTHTKHNYVKVKI